MFAKQYDVIEDRELKELLIGYLPVSSRRYRGDGGEVGIKGDEAGVGNYVDDSK